VERVEDRTTQAYPTQLQDHSRGRSQGTVTGNVTGQSGSTLVDATQDKGFVNAVSDCSVPSDRVSDIAASLNACILANPGKKILLPKLAAGSTQDYFSSTTILVKGLGTLLVGGGTCGNWGRGSVLIQFASGVAGIRRDTDNEDGGLECLSAVGGDAFCGNACSTAAALATYEDFSSESALQGTSGADGIQVLAKGHQWWVTATFFKRHGFLFNGNSVGQPDLVSNVGLLASFNRGYGYYTYGTDANVMVFTSLNNWYNAMGGIKDSSFYGNTWIGPHSSGNAAFLGASAGPNKTIAAANGLVVASNVLTITTTTAHGWSAGMWITTTGSTDTSYNGTCKLLTVPLTTTATCSFTHADGNTANGTAATSSSAQVKAYYVAASLVVGSYVSTSTAGSSTFVTPYSESTSGASVWGGALVLNPQGIDGGGSAGSATGHKIIGSSNGNMYFNTLQMTLVPRSNSGAIAITDSTGATTEWVADATGKTTQLGGAAFGVNPKTITGSTLIGLPNNSSIDFKTAAGGLLQGMYAFTDNSLNIGSGASGGIFLQGGSATVQSTFAVTGTSAFTGLTTHTGGAKMGASGSTISDSRELVQNAHSCGTTTTCANTANGSNRMIFGTVALSSGTPSTATVASITAFTSTSSYVCTLTNMTNAANNLLKVVNTSTTSFTITGPNTITDTIAYICIGN
jgi:hypothetical protein